MKINVKPQNVNTSYVEIILKKMKGMGLSQADLSRQTGVSSGVLSRFFNYDGISDRNLFAILGALNILKEDTASDDKTEPKPIKNENDLLLSVIAGRIDDLAKRIDAQGNALQGFQTDCLDVKNDIKDIYRLMTEAAEAKDVRKLRKVG